MSRDVQSYCKFWYNGIICCLDHEAPTHIESVLKLRTLPSNFPHLPSKAESGKDVEQVRQVGCELLGPARVDGGDGEQGVEPEGHHVARKRVQPAAAKLGGLRE